MALTIQANPYLFGWARNRAQLKLLCSGIQQSAGTYAHYQWTLATLGSSGSHVVLSVDGFELVYTVGTGSDAYRANSLSTLLTKMASNYYLNEVFTVTVNTTNLTLDLYGLAVGKHIVELYTTNSNGDRDGNEASLIASQLYGVTGTDKSNKDNYAVVAQVEVTANNYNEVSVHTTEPMIFRPDSSNSVAIPLDVLKGYIPQPDLPASMTSAWQLLTNALLKFRIRYGEMWGSVSPRVQSMGWTDYFYALCGEMVERYAAVNLPDWDGGQVYQLNDSNVFWVIGEDTEKTAYVRQSQPEWIYGLFYKSDIEIGTQVEEANGVTVTLNGMRSNGQTVNEEVTYQQVNGQVYRIDARPARLASDMVWYTVNVKTDWGEWSRTYHVLPDLYDQNYLLLQDKYGLLRVAVCGTLRRDVVTEGNELMVDRRRYLDLSRKSEVYTAVLSGLTKEAAARIGRSVSNEYHYIRTQGRWVRVTIEPATFTVRDDDSDLLTVELQLRFVEDQQENIGTGSMSRAVSVGVEDIHEQVVDFGEITIPESNNIF